MCVTFRNGVYVKSGGVRASASKDRCFRTRLQLERKPLHPHASPGKRRRDVQESALPVDWDAQVAAARVSRETETQHPRVCCFRTL
ncbi:hypothetical protein NDU88_004608 [Pleurodeles waltl]|uniref:Uncharacterized protein n=1 Tax=Pleurodeles waltl TaxID=8319 RepID=A0AAV7KYA0_PLEWA|nr:hypothetical protein NDU88_004608 [Pleurodeles waltl]